MSAYDKSYLNQVKNVTKFLFHLFLESDYDYYSCVCEYMSNSDIRSRMDDGNWSALNKGVKQHFNSIDYSGIDKSNNQYMDRILSDWIALIYVHFQWKYDISSSDIVRVTPPDLLRAVYNPLHEISIDAGCDKLYHKYWEDELQL